MMNCRDWGCTHSMHFCTTWFPFWSLTHLSTWPSSSRTISFYGRREHKQKAPPASPAQEGTAGTAGLGRNGTGMLQWPGDEALLGYSNQQGKSCSAIPLEAGLLRGSLERELGAPFQPKPPWDARKMKPFSMSSLFQVSKLKKSQLIHRFPLHPPFSSLLPSKRSKSKMPKVHEVFGYQGHLSLEQGQLWAQNLLGFHRGDN